MTQLIFFEIFATELMLSFYVFSKNCLIVWSYTHSFTFKIKGTLLKQQPVSNREGVIQFILCGDISYKGKHLAMLTVSSFGDDILHFLKNIKKV